MGGWANKSPLTEKKYGQFGFTSMEEAILTMDNVFVVVKEPEVAGLPTLSDWITAYYAEKGINIGVKKQTVSIRKTGKYSAFTGFIPFYRKEEKDVTVSQFCHSLL